MDSTESATTTPSSSQVPKELGYVLIRCHQRSKDSQDLDVEMTYEGDRGLASFLIDQAREYIDAPQ